MVSSIRLLKLIITLLISYAGAWVPRFALHRNVGFQKSFNPPPDSVANSMKALSMSTISVTPTTVGSSLMPSPGSPIVKGVNEETNVASIRIAIPGSATQQAFNEACDLFNEEVKSKGYKVAGFRPGSKLPPQYLFQIFGEQEVKTFCGTLLSEAILKECDYSGLKFVGRGRIMDFKPEQFQPGQPHMLEIECDLWPDISYGGTADGYKGLNVTVVQDQVEVDKIEKVKQSIREKYKVLSSTPVGYAAKLGDVLTINMRGYEKDNNGVGTGTGAGVSAKGKPLPTIAGGDQLEVVLEAGKFIPGLVEALVGACRGDSRSVDVTFPNRTAGPGAALSGKEALFEVQVLDVQTRTLPAWDDQLAASVREGLTLQALEEEVRAAIAGDASSNAEGARNDALANALLIISTVSKLPESLMEEVTKTKFQNMLSDFKEQGAEAEQLEAMLTPERYARYKEISRPTAEKTVKLGLLFRDILERERGSEGYEALEVTDAEITSAWEGLVAQAKQKKEPLPEETRVREEIENTLIQKKVFSFLAKHANITYIMAQTQPVTAGAGPAE